MNINQTHDEIRAAIRSKTPHKIKQILRTRGIEFIKSHADLEVGQRNFKSWKQAVLVRLRETGGIDGYCLSIFRSATNNIFNDL